MKQTYGLSILFVLFFINASFGQSCLPDGITFTTQEQVDNFTTDYPGCTEIGGTVVLSIPGNPGLIDLSGINHITKIHGTISGGSSAWPIPLSPLTSLTHLDYISIVNEPGLNFSNMPSLEYVDSIFLYNYFPPVFPNLDTCLLYTSPSPRD